jgi:hypothetical protein
MNNRMFGIGAYPPKGKTRSSLDDPPVGWLPFAYPVAYTFDGTIATPTALAANGGTCQIEIELCAYMALQSVSLYNGDTASARTWGWDLYVQFVNSGIVSENLVQRIANSSSDETFTPSAASIRTITAFKAPVILPPGVYWLAIQNRHASNTFQLQGVSANAFAPNVIRTKTTTNPNGILLDMSGGWTTGLTGSRCVRLNGSVFGESTAY